MAAAVCSNRRIGAQGFASRSAMVRIIRVLCSALLFLAPWLVAAKNRPVVLKAARLLDGKGQIIRNTIIVVEGSKIVRVGGAVPAGASTYLLSRPSFSSMRVPIGSVTKASPRPPSRTL